MWPLGNGTTAFRNALGNQWSEHDGQQDVQEVGEGGKEGRRQFTSVPKFSAHFVLIVTFPGEKVAVRASRIMCGGVRDRI